MWKINIKNLRIRSKLICIFEFAKNCECVKLSKKKKQNKTKQNKKQTKKQRTKTNKRTNKQERFEKCLDIAKCLWNIHAADDSVIGGLAIVAGRLKGEKRKRKKGRRLETDMDRLFRV